MAVAVLDVPRVLVLVVEVDLAVLAVLECCDDVKPLSDRGVAELALVDGAGLRGDATKPFVVQRDGSVVPTIIMPDNVCRQAFGLARRTHRWGKWLNERLQVRPGSSKELTFSHISMVSAG